MELSFGARLRAQRERQQISLSAISAATKIKISLLEELESDAVSHWPSGLFRRAYIRDYARAIGLDPEPIVQEFLERYPDPLLVAEAAAEAAARAQAEARSPEARLRRLFGAIRQRKVEPEPVADAPAAFDRFKVDLVPAEADDATGETFDLGVMDRELDPEPVPEPLPLEVEVPPTSAINLSAVADLCTRLAMVVDGAEVMSVLAEAAAVFDAVGVILWSWDARGRVLTPAVSHGYADSVVERLPNVRVDAPNAIAAAFRSSESCTVDGGRDANGALVVPLLGPAGAVGVLAFELPDGRERLDAIQAGARILAAQLATLLGMSPVAEAVSA